MDWGEVLPAERCSYIIGKPPFLGARNHFGVLHSQFHNAWMRTVAGRLKSDYRYSGGIVYNNFSILFIDLILLLRIIITLTSRATNYNNCCI